MTFLFLYIFFVKKKKEKSFNISSLYNGLLKANKKNYFGKFISQLLHFYGINLVFKNLTEL